MGWAPLMTVSGTRWVCKNTEKQRCEQPPRVLPPVQLTAPPGSSGWGSCLPTAHGKGLKIDVQGEERAGSWRAGEKLRDGGMLTDGSPLQNELGVLQAQTWSAAASMILTSPCSTPGHPKHALLSGFIYEKELEKSGCLCQCGTEKASTILLTLEGSVCLCWAFCWLPTPSTFTSPPSSPGLWEFAAGVGSREPAPAGPHPAS